MDGQLRSVWSEIRGNPSYNDADIGSVPTGLFGGIPRRDRGVVYKDFDGNGLQGRNEPGIPASGSAPAGRKRSRMTMANIPLRFPPKRRGSGSISIPCRRALFSRRR